MAITWPTDGTTPWGSTLRSGLQTLEGLAAGNYGPNWVAASNASSTVKAAVLGAGGAVCDGTADQSDIASKLASYGEVRLTEGTFTFNASLVPPARKKIMGSGPATVVTGAAALTGSFFSVTNEHIQISDLTIAGGAEATGTHGIFANVTSNTGFTTGSDACLIFERLTCRNVKGNGIRMEGTYNRDSKLSKIHVWNATDTGYYLNSPDGNIEQCIAGTCGGNGFEFASSSSNWHTVNSKAWYSDKDGWRIGGIRHTFVGIEGQDNAWAGIRMIANNTVLSGWLCDSNSYEGTTYDGIHSGLEVGRTTSDGTTFSNSGGFDISIGPGQSWDKNESARGFKQRSGVRLRSGIRGLTMTGVGTGDPAGTHHNVTAGIEFDSATDLTNAANSVQACLNHRVRINS